MKYELAKQLKDNGFLQPNSGMFFLLISEKHYVENGKPMYRVAHQKQLYTRNTLAWKGEYVWIPTLSELIQACADGFVELRKMGGGIWIADGHESSPYGSTPEEAVAKLWLALHT